MKKNFPENSPAKNRTTVDNLESRFDAGKDMLDHFDVSRAVLSHGGARPGAGRKQSGKIRKTVKLSPAAVRRFQVYAKRKKLPDFSAALEEASIAL
jgi:hypothetical protein